MRDPYQVLGVARGATFEEIRAAYRRASKSRHPDMGGTHEQMVELNTAYAFILNELKHGYSGKQQEAPGQRQNTGQRDHARREDNSGFAGDGADESKRSWQNRFRDIDDELEALRRASQEYDDRLRTMRQQAWASGEKAVWARLTWDDISRFFGNLARSGVKGLATIFAALVGVGTLLVEANLLSALVILGSGVGFFLSMALKSDKGGFMSAALLMFGVATIWLPPLRAALFGWPLASISVLICLALIFKFTRDGGIAGLMTGGLLGLFLITVILNDPLREQQNTATNQQPSQPQIPPAPPPRPATSAPVVTPTPPRITTPMPPAPPPQPPEPRELLAAHGSILKFADGIPYQLKVRSGYRTLLVASSGSIALYRGDFQDGDCLARLEFATPRAAIPYLNVDHLIRACDGDAVFEVSAAP